LGESETVKVTNNVVTGIAIVSLLQVMCVRNEDVMESGVWVLSYYESVRTGNTGQS